MDLDFLDGAQASQDATPAPQPEPIEQPADGPSRDDQGRFAPKVEADAPAAPEPATQSPPPPPEPQHVPLSAHLDEREKRQAAERRAADLEQRLAASQPKPEPQAFPDMFEDPAGYQAAVDARIQQAQWNAVTSVSQTMAVKDHGAEKVEAAAHAFALEAQTKPWLLQELQRQPHPYEYVVQRHQRETMLADLKPDELAQFHAWKTAQAQIPANTLTPAPAPIPQNPAPPRRSLAAATSAGAGGPQAIPIGQEATFDAVFQ